MLKILSPIEKAIFNLPIKRLFIILWVIQLLKTGIWGCPYLPPLSPFVEPSYPTFLFYNWLGLFFAWCLHIQSFLMYALMSIAFSCAFSWTMFGCLKKHLTEEAARVAIVIFFLLPASGTVYFWAGTDSITLFFMSIIFYSQKKWVALFGGVALGLCHCEQAFMAFGALLFCALFSKKEELLPQLLLTLAGIMCARWGFEVWLKAEHMHILSRSYWMWVRLPRLWHEFFFNMHLVIWSILGLGWIIGLSYAEQGRKTIVFFMTLFGLIGMLPFVEDQTRVYSVISFPLLTFFWLLNQSFLMRIPKKLIALLCLLSVLMPWTWVWKGVARSSVLPYDIALILENTVSSSRSSYVPTISEWPFEPLETIKAFEASEGH